MTESADDPADEPTLSADGDPADGWRVVVQKSYERWGNHDLTTTIIEAVAAAEGVPVTAIRNPPLYDSIDVASVENTLFGSTVDGSPHDTNGVVSFSYSGYRIGVRGDGWVFVTEPTD